MTDEGEIVYNYNRLFSEGFEQADAAAESMTEDARQPWEDLPTGVIYYEKMYEDGHLGSSTESPEVAYKLGWTESYISKDEVQQSDKNGWLYVKDRCPMRSEAELQAAANAVRIKELKEYLRETDYKAIKYAEGRLTDDEYAESGIEREKARLEIRRLEADTASLLS